jgi:Alkylmercury lyase
MTLLRKLPPAPTGGVDGRVETMLARDLEVRNVTYAMFVELGCAPTADAVAGAAGLSKIAVGDSWRRLHELHAVVLSPGTGEIRMANPFSAVPTAYRVRAAGRRWYANCAWDALGIPAALHANGRIETSCADCGEAIVLEVHDQHPDDERLLFHCLVPAAHWWDDIIFT